MQPPWPDDDSDRIEDPGRPLGLRLLALLGALAFVMLGLSSLAPLLHPPGTPRPQRSPRASGHPRAFEPGGLLVSRRPTVMASADLSAQQQIRPKS